VNWREKTRHYEPAAWFLGLAMMAASLTLSPFMMSVSQFFLLAVWLFMGDPVRDKLHRFFHNPIAIVVISIYLLHLIGLAYTENYGNALNDLRVKLPLITFPLLLASVKPLEQRTLDLVLLVYVLAVLVATVISFSAYLRHDYDDIRDISRFISHIRFCLNIVLVMGIIGYYLFTRRGHWLEKGVQVVLLAWFAWQLYLFESISGYLAFLGLVAATVVFLFFRKVKSRGWRWAGIMVLIAAPLAAGLWLHHTVSQMLRVEPVALDTLDRKTALGNDYWHDTVCFPVENGQYVGLYFCRPEMRDAWNRRSALAYDGTTHNGENLEATLARYLTSKGLRKDAEGVAALSEQDIHNVEQGVANYVSWSHPGVYARLASTLFEYSQYRRLNNPNGGSLSQRIEYTRASLYLIRQHPLFGVGTGDLADAYRNAYDEIHSPLEPQYRHRAHNQYLAITVAFGLIGLVVFGLALLLPYLTGRRHRSYLYTVFLVIALLSMLPEDTLETQAGASWFAFFNSLFIFASNKWKDPS
jgi:hypothetical protein